MLIDFEKQNLKTVKERSDCNLIANEEEEHAELCLVSSPFLILSARSTCLIIDFSLFVARADLK